MIIAFQTVLLIVILFSLLGIIGERKDGKLRDNLTAIGIVSIVAFIVSVKFL